MMIFLDEINVSGEVIKFWKGFDLEVILNHPKDVSSVIGKKIYCEIVETNGNRVKVHAKSDTMDEVLEFIKTD